MTATARPRSRHHLGLAAALAALAATGCATATPPSQPYHQAPEIEREVGYAQAMRSGDLLFVSGTLGEGATLEAQLGSVYTRLAETLAAHGATLRDVVKETIHTTDFDALIAAQPTRNRIYGGHTPAATWVQVERLYLPEAVIEIELTARLPDKR